MPLRLYWLCIRLIGLRRSSCHPLGHYVWVGHGCRRQGPGYYSASHPGPGVASSKAFLVTSTAVVVPPGVDDESSSQDGVWSCQGDDVVRLGDLRNPVLSCNDVAQVTDMPVRICWSAVLAQSWVEVSPHGLAAIRQVTELMNMHAVRSRCQACHIAHQQDGTAWQLGHHQPASYCIASIILDIYRRRQRRNWGEHIRCC